MSIEIVINGLYKAAPALQQAIGDIGNLGDAASQSDTKVGGLMASFGGFGMLAGGAAAAGAVALGAAIGSTAAAVVGLSQDSATATREIQAQLGVTADEAQNLSDIAVDVFGNNFGASVEDASTALIDVRRNLKGISDEELPAVTENALLMRDALGVEVADSTAAVNTLMKNFGLTSEQAFDFVTKGVQSGLDASGDFLDTIGEYSTQFSNGGASAEEFFSVLSTGMQSGVLGTDKAADMFKEFRLLINDGSQATADALTGLGLSVDAILGGLADGSLQTIDAFNMVTGALAGVEDQSLRLQLGVPLLGTQFEDLGDSAALAISTTAVSLESLAGSTDGLNAKYQTFGAMWEGASRKILVSLKPIADELLGLANGVMPYVIAGFDWFGNTLPAVIQKGKDAFAGMTGILDGVGNSVGLNMMGIRESVSTVLNFVTGLWKKHGADITAFTSGMWETITATWKMQLEIVSLVVKKVWEFIAFLFKTYGDEISAVVSFAMQTIGSVITLAMNLVQGVTKTVLGLLRGDWEMASAGIKQIVDGLTRFVVDGFQRTMQALSAIGATMKEAALAIGRGIVEGVVSGIKAGADWIAEAAASVARAALQAAKNALGIRSPSTAFYTVGQNIIAGIVEGINENKSSLTNTIAEIAQSMTSQFTIQPIAGAGTNFATGVARAGVTRGVTQNVTNNISIHEQPGQRADLIVDKVVSGLIRAIETRY